MGIGWYSRLKFWYHIRCENIVSGEPCYTVYIEGLCGRDCTFSAGKVFYIYILVSHVFDVFHPQDHVFLVTGAKRDHLHPAHLMDPPASCVHLVNTVPQVATLFIHLDTVSDFTCQNEPTHKKNTSSVSRCSFPTRLLFRAVYAKYSVRTSAVRFRCYSCISAEARRLCYI